MITNKAITYYHKTFDNENKVEVWEKYIFKHTWVYNSKNANINAGYEKSNSLSARIEMKWIKDKSLFNIGDIVAIGEHDDIDRQSDLEGINYFNVTSVVINDYGNNPHVHLGGQ